MVGEGMATYRDVIEMTGGNRTFSSFGQDADGKWQQFMNATYKRASPSRERPSAILNT